MSDYDELRRRVSDCMDDAGEFGGALLEDFEAAHAHELAEKQRAMVEDHPVGDLMRTFFRGAANLIDPEAE